MKHTNWNHLGDILLILSTASFLIAASANGDVTLFLRTSFFGALWIVLIPLGAFCKNKAEDVKEAS